MKYISVSKARLLAIIGLSLYLLRALITQDIRFIFLNWNLFLAWVPVWMAFQSQKRTNNWIKLLFMGGWLFFLPNSFYLFTDLIHLRWSTGFWSYYDALLILTYALSGAVYGFVSVKLLEYDLNRIYKWAGLDHIRGNFTLLLLCSFGVYIGRVGRWNTWDLLTRPWELAYYIVDITKPAPDNFHVFTFTGLFWLFLVVVYSSLYFISNRRNSYAIH